MTRPARLLLAILVGLCMASCTPAQPITPNSGAAAASFRNPSGTFTSGTSSGDAQTLNWIVATDAATFNYVGNVMDSLVSYDNNFKVLLRLAARDVDVSADGLTYTVTLRNDLKWSDGSKVTSDDFVYTLGLMVSDWLNYPYRSNWQESVDGKVQSVTAKRVSDTVFTVTRKTVDPEFIHNVRGLMPLPKALASKYDGNLKAFIEAPVLNDLSYTGNLGPYKLSQWIKNGQVILLRNPDYYLGKQDGSPYFDHYVIRLFATPAAAQTALEAGEITQTDLAVSQVARFKQSENVTVYTLPSASYTLLAYNMRNNGWEGLRYKEVRQALSEAVSKEAIIERALSGSGKPAYGFIPDTSPLYTEEGVARYGVGPLYSPQTAMEGLVRAGWAVKKADGTIQLTDKSGNPVRLRIITHSGETQRDDIASLVKQELAAIGIESEVKDVPWQTVLGKYFLNKVPGSAQQPSYNNGVAAVSDESWDIVVASLNTNPLSPSGAAAVYASTGPLNFFGYGSSVFDQLMQQARSSAALDPVARKHLYEQIARLVADDQPVNFLAFQLASVGVRSNVKGIDPGINMGYNFPQWYFGQ
jgi:peptide/nickel transport system substrate-binding protein